MTAQPWDRNESTNAPGNAGTYQEDQTIGHGVQGTQDQADEQQPDQGRQYKAGDKGRAPGINGTVTVLHQADMYEGGAKRQVLTVLDPNTNHHVQIDRDAFIHEDDIPSPGSEGA
jgi:hypothetical protein